MTACRHFNFSYFIEQSVDRSQKSRQKVLCCVIRVGAFPGCCKSFVSNPQLRQFSIVSRLLLRINHFKQEKRKWNNSQRFLCDPPWHSPSSHSLTAPKKYDKCKKRENCEGKNLIWYIKCSFSIHELWHRVSSSCLGLSIQYTLPTNSVTTHRKKWEHI